MLFVQRLLKENSWKYLAFFAMFCILGIVLQLHFQKETGGQYALNIQNLYVLLWYGREPVREYSAGNIIRIPGLWFWIHSVLYILLLRCTNRNEDYSYIWIVEQASRSRIWNQIVCRLILNTMIYMGLLRIAFDIAARIGKGLPQMTEGLEEMSGIYRHLTLDVSGNDLKFWMHVMIMPLLVCIALHMLQEVMAMFLGMQMSIVISFGYLFIANFVYGWGIIGNATMLSRSEFLGYSEDWWKTGLLCIFICILSYLIGYRRITKKDIMEGI